MIPMPLAVYVSPSDAYEGGQMDELRSEGAGESRGRQTGHWQCGSMGVKSVA